VGGLLIKKVGWTFKKMPSKRKGKEIKPHERLDDRSQKIPWPGNRTNKIRTGCNFVIVEEGQVKKI